MALSITQTDRTNSSVSFSISGLWSDRKVMIWIPWENQWYHITEALNNNWIDTYWFSGNQNGTANIYINSDYTGDDGFHVWDFQILGYNGSTIVQASDVLHTILKFEWDGGGANKLKDNIFNFSQDEMARMEDFIANMYYWIGGGSEWNWTYYTNYLYASDYVEMATKLYNTATYVTSTQVPNRNTIRSYMANIISFVQRGEDCKDYYFNRVAWSINNFNMTVTDI